MGNFQSKYAALNIPYPSDQGALAAIDAQAAEQKAAVAPFCAASNGRIAEVKAELAKWEAMQPVESKTEEALDAGLIGTTIVGIPHPDVPSFWPHTESWESWVERLNAAEEEEEH